MHYVPSLLSCGTQWEMCGKRQGVAYPPLHSRAGMHSPYGLADYTETFGTVDQANT
jgi:hypothetical protein